MNWIAYVMMWIALITDAVVIAIITYAILRARNARLRWKYAEIVWLSEPLRKLLAEVNPNPIWIEIANEKLANRKDFQYGYRYGEREYSSSSLCIKLFCSYDFKDLKLANEAMQLRRVLVNPESPDDSVLVSRISGGVRGLVLCGMLLSAFVIASLVCVVLT